MNPLFLLFGLFGSTSFAFFGSSRGDDSFIISDGDDTPDSEDGVIDGTDDDDDDTDAGGDGGMDMGAGDDSDMDDDDSDDGGMDHGDHDSGDGGTDMGGDDDSDDGHDGHVIGGNDGGTDTGDDGDDGHGGHVIGGNDGDTDTGVDDADSGDGGMDMGGDDDMGTPTPDGTPIVLILGQSNAGLLNNSKAMVRTLEDMGSEAQVIAVQDGGVSSASPDGAWNIVTGDGTDEPGYLYTELLATIEQIRADTPDAYIAGAVWMQGEADRSDKYDYYEPVKTLFTQMQDDIEDFPITIVGLSDLQGGNDAGRQHVQDAQMKLAEDLSFVSFVDPDEIIAENGLSEAEVMRDSLHFNRDFFDYVAEAVLEQPVMLDGLGFTHTQSPGMGGHDGHDDDTGSDTNDGGHGDNDSGSDGGTDMGSGDDGSDGGHDHDGHNTPHDNTATITPPGVGASNAEITSFLNALSNMPNSHSHDQNSAMADEHMAALGLVERGDATHVAIGDGDWDDPAIWSNGEVPGDDARVLIPEGVTVDYGFVSDARLFTVRVDGKLDFATDTDSQMIFDTMVVDPSGYLEIGTADDPVDPNVDVDLIVANNGRIDTDWDPMLLSRGIIAHGKTSIYGAEKDSHDKVTEDPMAGDTSIKFDGVPTGWQVGDTIVIAGTNYDGWSGDKQTYTPPEDEVREITQIDADGRVHFAQALENDHDTPRDDLFTSVANYTRSVSVESEDGADSEVFERGHVMFMHNDDVDVYYAEFTELGRTDKSFESRAASEFNSIEYDTNVQGRYALHLHRAGTESLEDPAVLEGNAVFGSPGWGYVHHDSNAILDNNASYDTFGAGFVAETGNETGAWTDNIAINAKGNAWNLPKNSVDIAEFYDIANGGDGFWFQGRMVAASDNVAASVNHGYVYFHRDKTGTMESFSSDLFSLPDALHFDETVRADDIPIQGFDGNEAFAANEGLHVVKANPAQGHDVWSHLKDFTAWNVETGAHLQYTSHYILENFDVIGKETSNYSSADEGILLGRDTTEITIIDPTVDSFKEGINLFKEFSNPNEFPASAHSYQVVGADFTNVGTNYVNYDPNLDVIISRNQVPNDAADLELERMVYSHSSDYHERVVLIEGTKHDSLGEADFPGGMDIFRLREADVARHMEETGYNTTSDGDVYVLINVYFTDRLTGEIHYETHPIFIDDNVQIGRGAFANAVDNGVQDITTENGVTSAGDHVLDTAFKLNDTQSITLAMVPDEAMIMTHEHMAHAEDADDDMMMTLMSGVIAPQGATEPAPTEAAEETEADPTAGRTQAIFETLATIEQDAQAADDTEVEDEVEEPNEIELPVSPEATMLMAELDVDELTDVLSEALEGALENHNAHVMIDLETSSVKLALAEGTGEIVVHTTQAQAADEPMADHEMIWQTLTCGQPAPSELIPDEDDEEGMLVDAA